MRTFRRQTQMTPVTDLRSERCISDCRTEYVLEDVDVSAKKSWRLRKSKCLTKRRKSSLIRSEFKGEIFLGFGLRERVRVGSRISAPDTHKVAVMLDRPPSCHAPRVPTVQRDQGVVIISWRRGRPKALKRSKGADAGSACLDK